MRCTLCGHPDAAPFARAWGRRFLRCPRCRLTFARPEDRPDPDAERARYETHENDPADEGYRAFLDRLAAPLADVLPAGARGLDYGSGPGPTLSLMLEERGHPMRLWDPFFAPDADALAETYDFVTCTETAEHFHEPGRELDRLDGLLRRPGWLAIMTGVLESDEGFPRWWYARDPTHVSFYRPETLEWMAGSRGWALRRPSATVALFRKG